MLKLLFLLWILFSPSISASASVLPSSSSAAAPITLREKPSYRNRIRRRIFGLSLSKIVLGNDDFSIESERSPGGSDRIDHSNLTHFILFDLPDGLIREILEYLLQDYASIRLTSKCARKTFDDLSCTIACNNFPKATEKSLPRRLITQSFSYKLLPLSRILFYNVKPFMSLFKAVYVRSEGIAETKESVKLIKFIRVVNIRECLILTSSLLKLGIIKWDEIYQFLFFNDFTAITIAWSLGLTTIAKEMCSYNLATLIHSIRSEHKGILVAIRGKHYGLSRFLIVSLGYLAFRAMKENTQYLDDIIAELIEAKFWDLLYKMYSLFDRHYYLHHLIVIAKHGDPEGLRVLKDFALNRPYGLGYVAATYGHLEFLRELDSMGLLAISCKNLNTGETAIHAAAFHGRTECLEFLVSRLGFDQLSVKDSSGYLPIHLASQCNSVETLNAIIRLHPFYSRTSFLAGLFVHGVSSPLQVAVACGATDAARKLLESFPELIYFKDARKETAVHVAITEASREMLELLLDYAPSQIIRARNSEGDTALHLAVKNSNPFQIAKLLATGHFTAFERNNLGHTPIYYFPRRNDNSSVMETFNLRDNDQLVEGLRVKERKLFNFNYLR